MKDNQKESVNNILILAGLLLLIQNEYSERLNELTASYQAKSALLATYLQNEIDSL